MLVSMQSGGTSYCQPSLKHTTKSGACFFVASLLRPAKIAAQISLKTRTHMKWIQPLILFALMTAAIHPGAVAGPANPPGQIVSPAGASPLEILSAREVRRYVYLRSGQLLNIVSTVPDSGRQTDAIIIARKDRPWDAVVRVPASLRTAVQSLQPQQYLLRKFKDRDRSIVLIIGGDGAGTLYGAYRFAEHLGVRFYLHGDVVPDERAAFELPALKETAKPLFQLRGIQPFHDFPEGPDWWNADDYLAIIGQLPKLRMNFFGLHTYPEGGPNAEPTTWIGLARDIGDGAQVHSSYPASYQNTLRGNWGYGPKKTSDFSWGGALLFDRDAFGADVMAGLCPQPATAEQANELFERTGTLFRRVFGEAQALGIKTCLGTETPLTLPKQLEVRLKSLDRQPGSLAVRQELYAGIFRRIMQIHPLDYYWFWTPEGWTWDGTKDEQVKATLDDLGAAIAAAQETQATFRLATCGWVLGPQQDRALFNHLLPKEIALSCINREVGKTPVDPAFTNVTGHSKWAIPWLEDDPALTSPQLWAGRMRRDARDARRYGCDGLMGIHWRTRVLGPAVAALAQAGWDQSGWNQAAPPSEPWVTGPVGGQTAAFLNNPIAGTADPAVYQTVRYNLSAYHLSLPNGAYRVTLKFCEPHYSAANKRVFGVKLQEVSVIKGLDIFARAGQNKALDFSYDNVKVTNRRLNIEFVPEVEFPSIAAIVVEGRGIRQKINCGGPSYKDYAADGSTASPAKSSFPPVLDFYADWARHEFGPDIGRAAASLFAKIDGTLPRPSDWIDGPGGVKPDPRPWPEVSREYVFVDEFAALASRVRGAGNRERYDYWLNTFRYLRTMAEVNCLWARYNQAIDKAKAAKEDRDKQALARQEALPLRRDLVKKAQELYDCLLGTVSTVGEMGTVANWEQHNLPALIEKPGAELARILGENLPADALLTKDYRGPVRIIVPAKRTSVAPAESLILKVIILAPAPPRSATLHWRPLGPGEFHSIALQHVDRGVYTAPLPTAVEGRDYEYYVAVQSSEGAAVCYPSTAPNVNQTVVVTPVMAAGQK